MARLCIYVTNGESVDEMIASYAESYSISWRNLAGRMLNRLARLPGVEHNQYAVAFIRRMHAAGVNSPRIVTAQ